MTTPVKLHDRYTDKTPHPVWPKGTGKVIRVSDFIYIQWQPEGTVSQYTRAYIKRNLKKVTKCLQSSST